MTRASFSPPSHCLRPKGVLVSLCALAVLLAPPAVSRADERSTGNALLHLRVGSMEEARAFIDEWEAKGARLPHVYPPDILIGDVPENLARAMARDRRVRALYRKPALLREAEDPHLRRIADSWNRERSIGSSPEEPVLSPALPSLALPPYVPRDSERKRGDRGDAPARYGRAFGAGYYQTSEIFTGRIAVGIVLPDSPEAAYAEHEVEAVLDAVRGAMQFWIDKVPYLGVRFYYDVRTGVSCARNFVTTQPRFLDAEWIGEILGQMGYEASGDDAAALVYPYIEDLRTGFGTEWGICFFIPKVSVFNANYLTYGRTGGPYSVLPAGSPREGNRWVAGRAWLSHLVIRETARLFWAENEYREGDGAVPCNTRSGYLGALNLNSRLPDYTCLGMRRTACCMDSTEAAVCPHTLAHMGLRNSDGDAVPDIFDTDPIVELEPFPDTITTVRPTASGRARVDVLPNRAGNGTRNAITFNTIEHIDYRIDAAHDSLGRELWIRVDPPEGWGDSTSVRFAIALDSLTAGRHRVAIRAVNTAGNASDHAGESTFDVYVRAVAVHDFRAEPDYEGIVRVAFRVRGKTLGAEGRLYRRTSEGNETVLHSFMFQEDGDHSLFDVGTRPGESLAYRLEARLDMLSWTWETSILGPAPIERGRNLSLAVPNPFRDATVISYYVPRGDSLEETAIDRDRDGIPYPIGTESAPARTMGTAVRYQETRVEIDIFDAAGRLVRSFPHVHSHEGFFIDPILWDGRDDSGRRLSAGLYLVRMKAGKIRETRKVILLP